MARTKLISVARDFSPDPGPRTIKQGRFSGEKFRALLVKALKENDVVIVDLDGTTGFGSSFLNEAFGGLIRYEGFSRIDLKKRLKVRSAQDESYLVIVEDSLNEARLAHA